MAQPNMGRYDAVLSSAHMDRVTSYYEAKGQENAEEVCSIVVGARDQEPMCVWCLFHFLDTLHLPNQQ